VVWDTAPRYLVRDNDAAYGQAFTNRIRTMGIRDRPIAPRSPWQNPYVERLIGTLRRECLDHVLIFGERHLHRMLTLYSLYYNETRTHLGLAKDAPYDELSNDPDPSSPGQFYPEYIMATPGYVQEGQGFPDALGKAEPVRKGHLRGPQPPPARGTLARTAALRQELLLRNEYLAAENRIPIRINIRAEAAPPFWSTARWWSKIPFIPARCRERCSEGIAKSVAARRPKR
jgi:integrase-like protein